MNKPRNIDVSETGLPNPNPVLAVDLDGTLIKSDMLYESFWSAATRDWPTALGTIRALARGRAALKRALVEASSVTVETLPYNEEVLNYIRAAKAKGARVALVTASDQRLADRIAEHLGLFDEVHGSDGKNNLKGEAKAAFLTDRYGPRGYVYMGDHEVDLSIWQQAAKAVTVNASEDLRAKANGLSVEVEHLGSSVRDLKPYAKAMRPHQWLKNILVFLPMLLGHQLTPAGFGAAFLAFVAFSMVASSVYVLNDLLDLAADRAHPRKRKRPFAAGALPIAHGTILAAGLLVLGAVLSLFLGWKFFLVMVVYYVMTTAYSLYFKRRVVIDICMLAGLYTLRIVAGGVAVSVTMSVWLLAFSIFLFFSLAAVKRQAELVDNLKAGKLSATGRGYHVDDLPMISQMAIAAGYISVLVMALYINSPDVRGLYASPVLLWGICLVLLFWVSWMVMTAHRGQMHDDPIVFAVKDRTSRLCGVLVVGFALAAAVL